MTSRDHVIEGMTKGGLREILFSPCNSLQSSMYAFGDTVVLIAALSWKIKTRACYDPAMRWDRWSHDIDGASEWTVQICSFTIYGSDPTSLNQQLWFISWSELREFQIPEVEAELLIEKDKCLRIIDSERLTYGGKKGLRVETLEAWITE